MPEEKKIIVDEDWKSQVEAEKEALKAEPKSKPPATEAADGGESVGDPPMPPASFDLLLSTLATEAMVALGAFPHPGTGKSQAHPNQAKYLIDTIAVLEEKTKGNLAPHECQAIEGLLHQLRMAYVAATSGGSTAGAGAGEAADGSQTSAVDLP